jgi:hypothetical protein
MMLVFHIILRNSKAKKFNDKGVKNMLPCWGPVAHIYNPSYLVEIRRIVAQGQLGANSS